VAVFGCGPVGQFAIASAGLLGAGRIFAIDTIGSRLEQARAQGAEIIDYEREDPIGALLELTLGIGVDRAIDAVGVDANRPHAGPAAQKAERNVEAFEREGRAISPERKPDGDKWQPGNAPSQVLSWAVEALAKAGTLSIIGVYPPTANTFPIGQAMNRNLTIKAGNCNHRRYLPELIEMVRTDRIDPTAVLTQRGAMLSAIEAYRAFDRRLDGWTKIELVPPRGDGARAPNPQPM
jgi:threonine dehydrogenase-like Zn-dependent dehydrogenase